MTIAVHSLPIPGCLELVPPVVRDDRGFFVKPYHHSEFVGLGLPTDYPERFYSRSRRDVVRGLHFQVPPAEQHKFVYCVTGSVLDVFVDLRVGSPTYGVVGTVELDGDRWNGVFLPSGVAHGFLCTADEAVMAYAVGSEYAPAQDTGIRWDSIEFSWPVAKPIVSERDRQLQPLGDFVSPFRYVA